VLSSKHNSSTGGTNGVGYKALIKKGSLMGNTINVGSVIQIMSIRTYRLKSMIIGHYKNNIGGLWFFLLTRSKKCD
jgi:hypothetical protein